MFYYVGIMDGKMISKNSVTILPELSEHHREISEELYNSISTIPCSFVEIDSEIISVEFIELPIVVPELTQEDYLIDLDYRISMIELGL